MCACVSHLGGETVKFIACTRKHCTNIVYWHRCAMYAVHISSGGRRERKREGKKSMKRTHSKKVTSCVHNTGVDRLQQSVQKESEREPEMRWEIKWIVNIQCENLAERFNVFDVASDQWENERHIIWCDTTCFSKPSGEQGARTNGNGGERTETRGAARGRREGRKRPTIGKLNIFHPAAIR